MNRREALKRIKTKLATEIIDLKIEYSFLKYMKRNKSKLERVEVGEETLLVRGL